MSHKPFFQNIGPWYMLRLRSLPFFVQDLIGFNIFWHLFLHSDNDVPHDHPWDSWSILLWGNIHEVRQEVISGSDQCIEYTTKRIPLFKPKFRSAKYRHVVKLNSKWAFTIFIPLIIQRTWYFYPAGEQVHWKEFLKGNTRSVKP